MLLCTRGRSRGMVSSAGSASTLHWATSADDTADSTWGWVGGGWVNRCCYGTTYFCYFLGAVFSTHEVQVHTVHCHSHNYSVTIWNAEEFHIYIIILLPFSHC